MTKDRLQAIIDKRVTPTPQERKQLLRAIHILEARRAEEEQRCAQRFQSAQAKAKRVIS